MNYALIQDREFTALSTPTSLPRLKHLPFIPLFGNVFVYPSILETCLNHMLLLLLFLLIFFADVTSFVLLNNLRSVPFVFFSNLFQLCLSRILFCELTNYIMLLFFLLNIIYSLCCLLWLAYQLIYLYLIRSTG